MPLADIADNEVHVSENGYTPQGPARWARAHRNAAKRPTSYGAKLFAWRLAVAHDVAEHISDSSFVFIHRGRVDSDNPSMKDGRREYTCTPGCAALLAQLICSDKKTVEQYVDILREASAGSTRANLIGEVFWGGVVVVRVDKPTLMLGVTCRVCAQPLEGDRAAVKAIAAKTEAVTQYVLLAGRFVPVAELRVVDLTDHDHGLLTDYGTADTRAAYVSDYGRRFDA